MEDSDLFQIELSGLGLDPISPTHPGGDLGCAPKINVKTLAEQHANLLSLPHEEMAEHEIGLQHPIDSQSLDPDSSLLFPSQLHAKYNSSTISYTFNQNDCSGQAEPIFHADTGTTSIRERETRVSTLYTEDRATVSEFLRHHKCCAATPQSSKVIMLDTQVSLRFAFLAFEENDTSSAVLWDSVERRYVGLITIGDLISSMLNQLPPSAEYLREEQCTEHVLERLQSIVIHDVKPKQDLITIESKLSMYDSYKTLSQNNFHRIPIIAQEDENIILYVLNATYIVAFLMKFLKKKLALFDAPLALLNIGTTATNLVTCKGHLSLCSALKILSKYQFSSLPIVDEEGRLLHVLYKCDLARVPHADLLKKMFQPVKEVMETVNRIEKKCTCCKPSEAFGVILNRMIDHKIRILAVVDECDRVTGVISLSDICTFFL